jgi:hypothetical protein
VTPEHRLLASPADLALVALPAEPAALVDGGLLVNGEGRH